MSPLKAARPHTPTLPHIPRTPHATGPPTHTHTTLPCISHSMPLARPLNCFLLPFVRTVNPTRATPQVHVNTHTHTYTQHVAGPGEPLRPLAAVASGGECARVMLALKAAPTAGAIGSNAARTFGSMGAGPGFGPSPSSRNGSSGSSSSSSSSSSQDAHTILYPPTLNGAGGGPTGGAHTPANTEAGAAAAAPPPPPEREAAAATEAAGSPPCEPSSAPSPLMPASAQAAAAAPLPHVPILVLDELDSGVGSRLGSSVGAMLRRMAAASSQVICVTHLPQVRACVRACVCACVRACVNVCLFVCVYVCVSERMCVHVLKQPIALLALLQCSHPSSSPYLLRTGCLLRRPPREGAQAPGTQQQQ